MSFLKILYASAQFNFKSGMRRFATGSFLVYFVMGPFFALLTSSVIAAVATGGQGSTSYFKSLTGGLGDYMGFATIGFAFNTLIFAFAFGGSAGVREEQEAGTAEAIFVSPANKTAWLMGKLLGNQFFSLISFVVILAAGFAIFRFGFTAAPVYLVAIVAILLCILSLSAMGFVLAGLTFFIKREDAISQALWTFLVFLCGLAYPIEILPSWLQPVAWAVPVTAGLDATRRSLLLGNDFLSPFITRDLSYLLLETIVLLPLGLLIYARLQRDARKRGTLSTY